MLTGLAPCFKIARAMTPSGSGGSVLPPGRQHAPSSHGDLPARHASGTYLPGLWAYKKPYWSQGKTCRVA